MITDVQEFSIGQTVCREGKVYCKLFDKEIGVILEDDVTLEYAEKCAEAMNLMPPELVDAICRAAKLYCIDYCEGIGASPLELGMAVDVDENTPPAEMLKCFTITYLEVDAPEDPSKIGYQLECECDWEEEHGLEIDVLENKLVYLGNFNSESPWFDHSDESWNYAAQIE